MENASHMPIACGYLDIRVLLIEDNPADARLVQEILAETRNSRFRLEHTNHLSAGLKLLAQEKFDLLLLDL
ncbi:MAG TPA: hypothetical protein VLB01_04710, partial [Thermodesulfobacteriota bacterium]|nr:hypothetical protein [Thermodesulfobacteriota bacterium]